VYIFTKHSTKEEKKELKEMETELGDEIRNPF
jgi:hypothetical protein